jgi:hypothetical protein
VRSEDIPEFAHRIHKEANRMTSLIEDIIRISRLDEQSEMFAFEPVDLKGLTNEITDSLQEVAKKRGISISVEGDVPEIEGVRQILYDMLFNLCDNAVKYNCDDGKIGIHMGCVEPEQAKEPEEAYVYWEIRDTGIGIPKEEKSMPSADLDSLLNLQNISAGPSVGNLPGVNSFLSPAEEIVKTDASKPMPKEKAADYFKTADFIPSVPSMSLNPTMNLGIPEITSQVNYDAETALQKLRDTISDLKAHGVRIHADEMNFETSYQIIIKLDK